MLDSIRGLKKMIEIGLTCILHLYPIVNAYFYKKKWFSTSVLNLTKQANT